MKDKIRHGIVKFLMYPLKPAKKILQLVVIPLPSKPIIILAIIYHYSIVNSCICWIISFWESWNSPPDFLRVHLNQYFSPRFHIDFGGRCNITEVHTKRWKYDIQKTSDTAKNIHYSGESQSSTLLFRHLTLLNRVGVVCLTYYQKPIMDSTLWKWMIFDYHRHRWSRI